MRLHVGFMMDPTAARGPDRVPPRSGCGRTAVRRPPLPRTGNSPCAPNALAAPAEAWEAERARGDRRIRWKAREIVRMRSSAAPGACAHAGHASRTLFANATADIFLRRYSLPQFIYCSYISMQNMLLQIFYVNILYAGVLRMLISLTPLFCLPPSSHHILNPDPIFPPSHKENT